jgi:hypothetical protein
MAIAGQNLGRIASPFVPTPPEAVDPPSSAVTAAFTGFSVSLFYYLKRRH